jgi:hypothetical protein
MMKKIYLIIFCKLLIFTGLYTKASSIKMDRLNPSLVVYPIDEVIVDNLPLKVLAYPNPAKERLTVESESNMNQIAIYNILGQKLKQFNLEGVRKFEFSVSDLSSGTYILSVQSGNQSFNQKFTKID